MAELLHDFDFSDQIVFSSWTLYFTSFNTFHSNNIFGSLYNIIPSFIDYIQLNTSLLYKLSRFILNCGLFQCQTLVIPLYTVAYDPEPRGLSSMTLLGCGKWSLPAFFDELYVLLTELGLKEEVAMTARGATQY